MSTVLSEASESQLRAIKHDPRLYMRNLWKHPNRQTDRYDFQDTNQNHRLDYLLDDDSPLNPEQWGTINILLWARGCLKTTSLMGISSWASHMYPGVESYMTAPREGQVKEFINKFSTTVEQTDLSTHRQKNSIGHQQFRFQNTDEHGNKYPIYSDFKTDTGWGEGDALRGPHSHIGIIDEFQDITESSFQTFSECIDQELPNVPYFPSIFIIGTPKLENSFFNEMWERSDQKTWDDDAKEWIAQSEATVYEHGEESQSIRGWHIDQYNCPLHSEASIERKRDTKQEKKFKNEVLAQFYSPEDELLAARHIDAIADPEMGFSRHRRYDDSYVTIGVDWGGGDDDNAADTVMMVGEHVEYEDERDETTILQIEFIDENTKSDEFDVIEDAIIQYQADRVVVDEGYGSKRREDLQNGVHTKNPDGYDEVVGLRFGNISGVDKVKWKDSDEKNLATADKTHQIKTVVDAVKDKQITLPTADLAFGSQYDDGTKLYDQLTAAYEERTETVSGRKKTRIASDRSDDAIDALTYMYVAYYDDNIGPSSTYIDFGGHARPGL